MYSRWKTHKWRKCQLVPWFLRQNSAGAQETCGPGLQTRGIETNLFISASSLHLHWTIPNHRKLNLCSLRCIWSPAMRQQMDVPRFREKANLLRAHIKSSHLQDSTHLEADAPKNICKRLFSDLFLFFVFLQSLERTCAHNSSYASWDVFDSFGCFTAGFFFASGSCHAILIKCLLLKFRRRYAAPCL